MSLSLSDRGCVIGLFLIQYVVQQLANRRRDSTSFLRATACFARICHANSVTKGRCINLTASPSTGAPNTRGIDFRPLCGYISDTVIDRVIVTMEEEYKVVCALSNSATFDNLE